jgi:uncharacterized membrane protein YeiH
MQMYLPILNYVGDFAFAAGGILMARKLTKNRLIWLVAAALTAFGGGFFIRDLMMLQTIGCLRHRSHGGLSRQV